MLPYGRLMTTRIVYKVFHSRHTRGWLGEPPNENEDGDLSHFTLAKNMYVCNWFVTCESTSRGDTDEVIEIDYVSVSIFMPCDVEDDFHTLTTSKPSFSSTTTILLVLCFIQASAIQYLRIHALYSSF